MDKQFKIWTDDPYNLEQAANIGWDDPAVGAAVLDALELGARCQDDDGDTWARIA